jgi:glycosyltransferase involved in cell wall biosynthesis
MNRALKSALAQTHAPLEVVVVGDAAGGSTGAAIEALGDPRVRFFDLTQRFVHPVARRHWLTAATLTRNEAYRQAQGRWIADLDDDDALRPDAVERLLALARAQRLEVAYGTLEQHHPTGPNSFIGTFPPRLVEEPQQDAPYRIWEGRASCGALVHAGLRLFAREHIAAEIGQPGDFYRVERMVLAGVRFGMLDAVVYDYYPSWLWER